MIRTLPSITVGNEKTLNHKDVENCRVIIQEKVDGSQLTIFRQGDKLIYYNKNKQITGQGKPWLNSYILLNNNVHLFKEGLFYHGEAMKSIYSSKLNVRYEREPRYFWIVYEIVREEDNTTLTPEEMDEVLEGTGIETVPILYDNLNNDESEINKDEVNEDEVNYIEKAKDIIRNIEDGSITSCFGNVAPEGVVLKVLNRNKGNKKKEKMVTTRYKFVRTKFSETNSSKKQRLPELSQDQIIDGIGNIYNTDARKQKAVQHLEEQGKWKDKISQNIGLMVNELDADLLKECEQEIKDLLFVRFWPQISKVARGNIKEFLTKL